MSSVLWMAMTHFSFVLPQKVTMTKIAVLLPLQNTESRSGSDVTKIWCEYEDEHHGGHAFALEDVTNFELHRVMNFSDYGR